MSPEMLRIALVSTPRSGNTWLRRLLARALELTEIAVHLPSDVNWESLPERFILQIHWLPDEQFLSLLSRHGFRTIVIARHPLDVLISILVFTQHDRSTTHWLEGLGGNEKDLEGATPSSEAFQTYATGPRAKALLSISAAWWQMAESCRVRYEDLVRDPHGQLSTILGVWGVSARKPLYEAIEESTSKQMQAISLSHLYHVWNAQPGAWKRILTGADARRICETQKFVIETIGYMCDPDDSLQRSDALLAWDRISLEAMRRTVYGVKDILAETSLRQRQDYAEHRAENASLLNQLQSLRELHQAQAAAAAARDQELVHVRAEVEALANHISGLPVPELRALGEIGPWSLGALRTLKRGARRFPRVAATFKALMKRIRSIKVRLLGSASERG
jgi:hypothetical protein